MKGYYAFWRYDLFPYVLGGTITKMREDGCVGTVEYGSYFNPVKILPVDAGKELHKKIEALARERADALKKFNADWDKALAKLIKIK